MPRRLIGPYAGEGEAHAERRGDAPIAESSHRCHERHGGRPTRMPNEGTKVSRKERAKVTQIRRTIVSATAALAIVLSSVTTAQVDAAGRPKCLAAPCPPPTNQQVAPADGSTGQRDAS